ncbi:diguanylate cyclase (GGDEF)-like protein [Granulicella aggregans]|uniref:Diguanylate cyclase (GGDEF)-like protein n=1 Tax=Granulicella aggregans TaxID=474949 RepID=A0A7W7ZFZ4_9BACT|nr:GGDEF domain-containing protein [Granulicella aggregans]MBB5059023.1 diguanylate cyclase (GGDEF)-like protein [Granulicella aggregans]
MGLGIALALLPGAICRSGAQGIGRPDGVLHTVREIEQLPPAEAAKGLPVHLTATITYYEPGRYTMFVADPTGGIYVGLVTPEAQGMRRGDLIEIAGITNKSYKTTVIKPHIRVLGPGSLPAAKAAGFRELMSGDDDCQLVKIRGTVRSASIKKDPSGKMAQLEIQIPGGLVRAYIEDREGVDLTDLIDAEVEFSGVAGGIFNGRKQLMQTVLYGTNKGDLMVLRPAKVRPRQLPWTAIDDVLQTRYVEDRSERVRVRGAVTFYEPANSIVIQHDGESLLAQTHDLESIALGQVVDLVGFADGNGSGPMLDEAQIFPTGEFETVMPRPVSYEDAITGLYSEGLVTLEGKVLSELHGEVSDSMVITVDEHPVNVLLWTSDRLRLQPLAVGTVVKVTGICHITKTDPWGNSVSFLLEMREAGDVTVVRVASWWTVLHLLLLLLALLVVSLTVTGWALALRRRVTAQAERIQQSMAVERERGRLLEAINSQMPLTELMEDICGSFEELVAEVTCSYDLLESCCDLSEDWTVEHRAPDAGVARGSIEVRRTPVFEAMMTDTTGAAIGVFRAVGSAGRKISAEEREALTVCASLANIALNQRRLFERLNFTSTHDPLTGLPNRRLSDLRLDEALRDAKVSGRLVGVVYIDVDHFKQVNDVHGHKTGDLYLQAISERLNGKVRSSDLLARIGGDEFMLTATLRTHEDAEMYRQRLKSSFEERFHLEGVVVDGSASIGLAVFPVHGTTAEELQRHADLDMYAAKERRHSVPRRSAVEVEQRLVS